MVLTMVMHLDDWRVCRQGRSERCWGENARRGVKHHAVEKPHWGAAHPGGYVLVTSENPLFQLTLWTPQHLSTGIIYKIFIGQKTFFNSFGPNPFVSLSDGLSVQKDLLSPSYSGWGCSRAHTRNSPLIIKIHHVSRVVY
jgi:hypothetical protein